jgi:hypothetical protein
LNSSRMAQDYHDNGISGCPGVHALVERDGGHFQAVIVDPAGLAGLAMSRALCGQMPQIGHRFFKAEFGNQCVPPVLTLPTTAIARETDRRQPPIAKRWRRIRGSWVHGSDVELDIIEQRKMDLLAHRIDIGLGEEELDGIPPACTGFGLVLRHRQHIGRNAPDGAQDRAVSDRKGPSEFFGEVRGRQHSSRKIGTEPSECESTFRQLARSQIRADHQIRYLIGLRGDLGAAYCGFPQNDREAGRKSPISARPPGRQSFELPINPSRQGFATAIATGRAIIGRYEMGLRCA